MINLPAGGAFWVVFYIKNRASISFPNVELPIVTVHHHGCGAPRPRNRNQALPNRWNEIINTIRRGG